jgi:hypothetical protein
MKTRVAARVMGGHLATTILLCNYAMQAQCPPHEFEFSCICICFQHSFSYVFRSLMFYLFAIKSAPFSAIA